MFILGRELNSNLHFATKKYLDGTSATQKTLADNIANMDTPGFKRSEVHFKDALNNILNTNNLALATTNSKHIPLKNTTRAGFAPSGYSK